MVSGRQKWQMIVARNFAKATADLLIAHQLAVPKDHFLNIMEAEIDTENQTISVSYEFIQAIEEEEGEDSDYYD